jgi:DNA repair protein RadB
MVVSEQRFSLKDLTEFLPKTITQIYGEPASGKTNICLLATADVAGGGKKVIFIDTEGSFSKERFDQISGKDNEKLLKNIILAEPSDFDEQKIAINKLEDLMIREDVGLVVVDSLVSLYRLQMGATGDPYEVNREMGRQLSQLLKVSKKYNIPVIVTNQIYATFDKDGSGSRILPVGKDLLKYWTKIIIHLTRDGRYRIATVVRHNFKPEGSKVRFSIDNKGIKEVPIPVSSSETKGGKQNESLAYNSA